MRNASDVANYYFYKAQFVSLLRYVHVHVPMLVESTTKTLCWPQMCRNKNRCHFVIECLILTTGNLVPYDSTPCHISWCNRGDLVHWTCWKERFFSNEHSIVIQKPNVWPWRSSSVMIQERERCLCSGGGVYIVVEVIMVYVLIVWWMCWWRMTLE